MRIGILTLALNTNYGGILQAYALQTLLERLGHKVVVFDTPKQRSLWILLLKFAKRTLLCCQGQKCCIFWEWTKAGRRPYIAGKKIYAFVDEHLHRKVIMRFSQLKEADYDAIVVGSDQVWRPRYFIQWGGQVVENAYLSFAKDWHIKRVAYAASFGTEIWEYDDVQTIACKALAQKFDAVSTREADAVALCWDKFGVEAQHVLDPTMLLSREDYCELLKDTHKSAGTLLTYVLDKNADIDSLIKKIAERRVLIPFEVNVTDDMSGKVEDHLKISPAQWLRGFYDAKFVITDSFHACVFSILFQKQFVVVGNKSRGMARFTSLLGMFGLEDRLVDASTDIDSLQSIDYNNVYAKLGILRQKSLEFLKSSLAR